MKELEEVQRIRDAAETDRNAGRSWLGGRGRPLIMGMACHSGNQKGT